MQFSLASCLILALGATAAPLEERESVSTAAVAGPGQDAVAATRVGPDGASGTGFTIDSQPTPDVQQFDAGSKPPKVTGLPSDITDNIPSGVLDGSDAAAMASAGAEAAVNAMSSDFLNSFGSGGQTCYGSYNDDGSMYVEYYFDNVSPDDYDSFCGDWQKAIKGSKSCPKEMYAKKGWMDYDYKTSGKRSANGYASGWASVHIPKGVDEKSAMKCLSSTYSGSLKSPYGKIGSCGKKYQTTKSYRVY